MPRNYNPLMEDWEKEFHWLHVRNTLKDQFKMGSTPDLNVVLLFIGLQELGYTPPELTKEIKQDLMHVGVCTLLSMKDYFILDGHDSDGWPHFRPLQKIDIAGEIAQENLLIDCAISYFAEQLKESNKQS